MTVYSVTADVRRLARSVLPADFSDAVILDQQEKAQAKIWVLTKKTDWDVNDFQYEHITKMEEIQAAIYVLQHYGGSEYLSIIESWQRQVEHELEIILESIDDPLAEDVELEISSKAYETYPKNLNARISRGRLTKVGFNPATDMDTTVYSSKYDL